MMPASLPELLPIERLTLLPMDRANSGALLVKAADYGGGPYLILRDQREGEPRTYALPLYEQERDQFRIIDVARNSGNWLAIDAWQLLVDPTSAYMGTTDMPQAGDAFISDGAPGIVARWNHATAYVSRSGEVLAEPNWGNGYVGFRSWSIGIDVGVPGKPHVLLSRTRQKT
jgi:hypothetical protein